MRMRFACPVAAYCALLVVGLGSVTPAAAGNSITVTTTAGRLADVSRDGRTVVFTQGLAKTFPTVRPERVLVWRGGRIVLRLRSFGLRKSAILSPSGQFVLVNSPQGVKMWSVTQRRLVRTFRNRSLPCLSRAVVSDDDRFIVLSTRFPGCAFGGVVFDRKLNRTIRVQHPGTRSAAAVTAVSGNGRVWYYTVLGKRSCAVLGYYALRRVAGTRTRMRGPTSDCPSQAFAPWWTWVSRDGSQSIFKLDRTVTGITGKTLYYLPYEKAADPLAVLRPAEDGRYVAFSCSGSIYRYEPASDTYALLLSRQPKAMKQVLLTDTGRLFLASGPELRRTIRLVEPFPNPQPVDRASIATSRDCPALFPRPK